VQSYLIESGPGIARLRRDRADFSPSRIARNTTAKRSAPVPLPSPPHSFFSRRREVRGRDPSRSGDREFSDDRDLDRGSSIFARAFSTIIHRVDHYQLITLPPPFATECGRFEESPCIIRDESLADSRSRHDGENERASAKGTVFGDRRTRNNIRVLRIFMCVVFDLERSRCKQAYIEYESQSEGISSRQQKRLSKQKRIAVARQLPSGEKQCL